jgi:starvation-inducible DNA-binding protein
MSTKTQSATKTTNGPRRKAGLRATRIDLPPDVRMAMVALLNARLADATDYALSIKQAHWNVRGLEFISLHKMLDEMFSETVAYADLMAERAVILGGQARGTLQSAAEGTTLAPFPTEASSVLELVHALAVNLGKLAKSIRAAADQATNEDDLGTADLFTEVSRGLDKQLWYLEAHLAG